MLVAPQHRKAIRPSGLADAISILQTEIICEARRWIGVVEVPTGANRGPEVDQFNLYYWGPTQWAKWTETERRQPYCTTFAFWVIDRVIKRLGGQNRMPGATARTGGNLVWGNALRTLNASREAGLRVDTIPGVGSVFYRTSTQPGDGSSGHMGIVVSVQSDRIVTVEGNQGTTQKVDLYTYPKSELVAYQFQFIHVEETAITATKNTDLCVPQNNGSSTPSTGSQQSGSQSGSQQQNQTGSQSGSQQQSQTGSQQSGSRADLLEKLRQSKEAAEEYVQRNQAEQQKPLTAAEACRGIDNMPCGDVSLLSGQAWGQIRDMRSLLFVRPEAADDITGAWRRDKYNSIAARNGIMTRPTGILDPNGYSGWGMLRDQHGNLWYIVNADTPSWSVMYDMDLFGQGVKPYIFPLIRQFGDNFRERTSEVITGLRDQDYGFSAEGNPTRDLWQKLGLANQGDLGFGPWKDDQFTILGGRNFKYSNGRQLFDEIQKIGRLDRPIVMLVGGSPFTWSSAGKLVTEIADYVINVAGPFAAQLGIPYLTDGQRQIISSVSDTIKNLIESQSPITISTVLNSFGPIVKSIVPESVRPYVDTGVSAYAAIDGSNWTQLPQILGVGLEGTELDRFVRTVRDQATGAIEQLVGKSSFNDIRGKVENVLNSRAVQGIGNRIANSAERGRFPSISKLTDDADLRQILGNAAGTSTVLSMLPGITPVMQRAIEKEGAFGEGHVYKAGTATAEDQRIVQALTHTALGIPGDPEALGKMSYAAINKSADLTSTNWSDSSRRKTFVLPANVPESKAECWAAKIRECNNIDVLIKGQDSDGVIRLDTQMSTRTTTINIPADFDRSDRESTKEIIDRSRSTGITTSGAIERLVEGSNGTIIKETITTDTSNARDRDVRSSTSSVYGSSGGDNIITTTNTGGGFDATGGYNGGEQTSKSTYTYTGGGGETAEEIARRKQLEEYERQIKEQELLSQRQEEERRAREMQSRKEAEERDYQNQVRKLQEEEARQRTRLEEERKRADEDRARQDAIYRQQQQDLERQRQQIEQQKLIEQSAQYGGGGSYQYRETRLPDPVEYPTPDQPQPVIPPPPGSVPPPDPVPPPGPSQGRIITCPDGYIWDAVAQACVPDTVPQKPPTPTNPTPQHSGGGGGCGCGGGCGGDCGCGGNCGCGLNGLEFY